MLIDLQQWSVFPARRVASRTQFCTTKTMPQTSEWDSWMLSRTGIKQAKLLKIHTGDTHTHNHIHIYIHIDHVSMEWIQLRYGKYQSKISWRSFKVSMKKLPVSGFYAYTILWLDSKALQKGPSVLAHQTTHAEIGSKAVFFSPLGP